MVPPAEVLVKLVRAVSALAVGRLKAESGDHLAVGGPQTDAHHAEDEQDGQQGQNHDEAIFHNALSRTLKIFFSRTLLWLHKEE